MIVQTLHRSIDKQNMVSNESKISQLSSIMFVITLLLYCK